VLNSHRIHGGHMIPLKYSTNSEFQFVPMGAQEDAVKLVVEIAAKLKERDANFQVLSPMYKGIVGVDRLNEALRERLNPPKGQQEGKFGPLHVRVGDRLMVIKNDYGLGVYNGDVGKLIAITRFGLHVRIHAEGNTPEQEVTFPKSGVWNVLRLAYAITVHKCQGSEFDTIILPTFKSQGQMLQRNLFYTALTRARSKVWLLGEAVAIGRAIDNDRVQHRNTVFGRRISDEFCSIEPAETPSMACEAV
jgi:exodeoxyribonuclease V alpha subunit